MNAESMQPQQISSYCIETNLTRNKEKEQILTIQNLDIGNVWRFGL